MARNRLTEEEFDEVFTDHLTRNPMVRSSFTRLPEAIREKLKDEWYDIWRILDLEDLQAASRLFLRDPDHALAPGRDLNKHCGRVFKVANELARSRRSGERHSGSEWAPGDGPARPGCPICKGDHDRRIPVWPFGVWKAWAIELRGEDHWKAVRAVMLICPCNDDLINALEDRHGVDANEDRFPHTKPKRDEWPFNIPTIYNEDRHERYDFPTYFLTFCAYEREVLELGKPRGRFGKNPISGETTMDDIVDAVWGDDALRPEPKPMDPPKFKKSRTDRPIYTRPPADSLGKSVTGAVREISARNDRQLPPGDRDDHGEGSLEDAREAKPADDDLVDFPGTDEDVEKFSGLPSNPDAPENISKEELRRRRRAALGKD